MIAAPVLPLSQNPALTRAAVPSHSFAMRFGGVVWVEGMPKIDDGIGTIVFDANTTDINRISTASRIGGVEPPGIHGRDARPAPGGSGGGAGRAAASPNIDE